MNRRTNFIAMASFVLFSFSAYGQRNYDRIVQEDHDRRIKAQTENNTKYHNHADDYSKRSAPKPIPARTAPARPRPAYVPQSAGTFRPSVAPVINTTRAEQPTVIKTEDPVLVQAGLQLFGGGPAGDPAEPLKIIREKMNQGSVHAQYLLGRAYEEGRGLAKNDAEALRLFTAAAELGDRQARYRMAMAHWNGELTKPVTGYGLKIYLKDEIAAGDPDLNYMLALAHWEGSKFLDVDKPLSAQFYKVAADHGSAAGCARLADMYFMGDAVEQDFNKSVQLARKAAGAGQVLGTVLMALSYRAGVGGLPKDPAKSLELMKDAAARGDEFSKGQLASGFDGKLIGKDTGLPVSMMKLEAEAMERDAKYATLVALPPMTERATAVFEKVSASNPRFSASQMAAMQKAAGASDKAFKLQDKLRQNNELNKIDWKAVYLLGRAYLHGDGVPVDLDRARTLLAGAKYGGVKAAAEQISWAYYLKDRSQKAAGKLDGDEMGMLAVYAADAYRDAPSPVRAYLRALGKITLFYTIAEKRGDLEYASFADISDAQIELAYMHWQGKFGWRNTADGLRFMEMAAKTDPNGMYALGAAYSGGYYGVPQDRSKAFELFRAAAALDQAQAQHMLAVAYYRGITVAKDDPTAMQWAVKPAQAGRSQDQVLMARLLQNGVGVPHDAAKSLEWMRKAAANGDEEAKAEIAKGFSGQ